jgi:hypothetical protein
MPQSNSSGEHLSAELIAAYLDRTLSPVQQDEIEGHLTWCGDCRLAAVEAAEVITRRRRRRYAFAGVGTAAAAAAAAVALFMISPLAQTGPREPLLRSTGVRGTDVPAIPVVSPVDGGSPGAEGLSFVWRSVGSDIHYRFSLSTADGTELWGDAVTDTFLTVPADVELVPGETYVWFVDALLPDGRAASTGLFRLTIEP